MTIKWVTYINGGKVPADKAAVVDAIKAAFQAYDDIECANLTFEYAGEVPEAELSVTQGKDGHILVYFGHDAATWIYGNSAYFRYLKFATAENGDITAGVIGLNAKDWDWVIGAEPNKLDIQTAVTQLIPNVLGYHASDDPVNGTLAAIAFNTTQHALTQEQIDGAKYTYFDEDDAACTQPAPAAVCSGGTTPTGDGSTPTGDGSTPTGDGSTTPTGDTGTTTPGDTGTTTPGDGGTTTGDGGTTTGDGGGGGDDDGCCRVSHARSTSLPFVLLVGLALLFGLVRRRR